MIRDASPAKALGFVGLACREEPEPNYKIKIGGKGSALSLKESVQWCDLNCTLLVFPNSIVCDGKSNHFALNSLIFVFCPHATTCTVQQSNGFSWMLIATISVGRKKKIKYAVFFLEIFG